MSRRLFAALAVTVAVAACSSTPGPQEFASSVFHIRGEGCRVTTIGTAFAVTGDLVVTNAHTLAGATSVQLIDADDVGREATLLVFDPEEDLALLRVDGLEAEPLVLGSPVTGHALLVDARIRDELSVTTVDITELVDIASGDIYDDGEYLRRGMTIAADISPGSSGSPVVVDDRVVGAVFAEQRRGGVVFATSVDEIAEMLDRPRSTIGLPTGRCRR